MLRSIIAGGLPIRADTDPYHATQVSSVFELKLPSPSATNILFYEGNANWLTLSTPMASVPNTSGASPPSETSPLLRPAPNPVSDDAIERDDNGQEESGVPIAKEPSATKLWLILSAVWVGVFLGALGMFENDI